MSNPFSLTFGREPASLISREMQVNEIIESFDEPNPAIQVYMITGVRGSGKTVMMTTVAKSLAEDPVWVVIHLNPERDMLHTLAAELCNRKELLKRNSAENTQHLESLQRFRI